MTSSSRLLVRRVAAVFLAAGAIAAGAAPEATAYGVGTHAWIAEDAALRVAAADPSFSFLATDPDARACFVYGAMFPDMRSTGRQSAGFNLLKQKMLASGFVDDVLFSTDEVAATFALFDTHDGEWLLSFVEMARASGDRYKLAFALGNHAHQLMDKHAQIFAIPAHVQSLACGDLGVEPTEDPAAVGPWYAGYENELLFEGMGDFARSNATFEFVKNAPWRLAADPAASIRRSNELRHYYWESAVAWSTANGLAVPSEKGIKNGARVFELAMTFYAFFTAHEAIGDAMRSFVERYLDLTWWASALTGIVQLITNALTGGQDVFDLVGPLLMPAIGGQLGGTSPLGEIMFYYGRRDQAEIQRLRATYAANAEFQRLDASGLLDPATYTDPVRYEPAHWFVVDGLTRGRASLITDDIRWPRYSREVMRGAGIRSLLRALSPDGAADAPGLLVHGIKYLDGATGAVMAEIALPGDVGRPFRTAVDLFGALPQPIPRIVRLRLRADTGAGAADPIVAESTALVPAALLDPRAYLTRERPVVAVDWTIADVPGARGFYVELDEPRLGPPGDDAADALLTTEMSRLAPVMGAGPHYAVDYTTYAAHLGSIKARR